MIRNNTKSINRPDARNEDSVELLEELLKVVPRTNKNNRFEPNWDIIGVGSVAITLTGAAILYIAGWVYEAYWYSYFGIDISNINLASYQIMIEGVPGTIVLAISLIIATLITSNISHTSLIYNFFKARTPILTLLTVFISSTFIGFFSFIYSVIEGLNVPLAAYLTLGPSLLILYTILLSGILFVLAWISKYLNKLTDWINALARQSSKDPKFIQASLDWEKKVKNFLKYSIYTMEPSEALQTNLSTLKPFSRIMIIVLLLVSISSSALLGRLDAHQGTRTLSGEWKMSPVLIIAKDKIWSLEKHSTINSSKEYSEYGPFALIAINNHEMYITKWKETTFFKQPIEIYRIPTEGIELRATLSTPSQQLP